MVGTLAGIPETVKNLGHTFVTVSCVENVVDDMVGDNQKGHPNNFVSLFLCCGHMNSHNQTYDVVVVAGDTAADVFDVVVVVVVATVVVSTAGNEHKRTAIDGCSEYILTFFGPFVRSYNIFIAVRSLVR
jgi:hypothetical protein